MKNKKLLFGTLSAILVTSAVVTSTVDFKKGDAEAKYSPRDSQKSNTGWTGAKELYKQLRKNNVTGQIEHGDYVNVFNQIKSMNMPKAQTMGWEEHGPDNIGGRTRAILIDKDDNNIMFAGSVSGGLWKSEDGANTWSRVDGFYENLGISSICQTDNGNIYVGTGHTSEGTTGSGGSGYNGDGVYMSTDGGVTFTQIAGTENYSSVNEVLASGNDVFFATGSGVIKYSGGNLDTKANGTILSMSISEDKSILIYCAAGRTFISTDSGNSFNEVSGISAPAIPFTNMGRIEYGISAEKVDGFYKIYAACSNTSGRIRGVWTTHDNGASWTQTALGYSDYSNPESEFAFIPYSTSRSAQGNYNNIVTVDPTNPDRVILGGIDLYDWTNATGSNPSGEWNKISLWFADPTSPLYVHADNHELKWNSDEHLFIGNDGGIGKSTDKGETFYPANRGYNVTQFYSLAFSAHGDVMGGTQDNGTVYNDHTMFSYKEFREVMGGDGFACDISFRSRDIMFASIYNGSFQRSNDRGQTWQSFNSEIATRLGATPGTDLGGFYTVTKLYENPNDLNSGDTINYIPTQAYSTGDVVRVPSFNSQDSIDYVVTQNIQYDDTIYYNPGLTNEDTVVGTSLILNGVIDTDTIKFYDLGSGDYDYELTAYNMANANKIDYTDTVIVYQNAMFVDSVYVDSLRMYNHYFAQNGSDILDMGSDTVAYGVSWDTLRVQDIRQSWYAFGIGGTSGVWITREAMHFSGLEANWHKVLNQGGQVKSLEFSKDGHHLFVGTYNGELFRISGFEDVYSQTPQDSIDAWIDLDASATPSRLTTTQIFSGSGVVTGIATSVTNPEHVVITTGGFGGGAHVHESTTAASALGTGGFSSIQGNLPSMPVYDAVIERDDANTIIVGTEFGVWSSDDGGSTWTNNSEGFGNVPVFAVRQSWRTWGEGNYHPGKIFIGTHGRGIWSSDTYLGLPDDNIAEEVDATNVALKVYPNPLKDNGTLEVTLNDNDDVYVQIYSLTGKLVKEISKTGLSEGTHQINFNVSDLTNGVYIIKTKLNGVVKTSKIVKS